MKLFSTIALASLATTLYLAPSVTGAPAKPSVTAVPSNQPPFNSSQASWPPANARNGAAKLQGDFVPYRFHDFVRYAGCHNAQYHSPQCKDDCPRWTFIITLPAKTEFCLYHTGDLDTTSCVIFSESAAPQDANYLIQQIFKKNLFNFKSSQGISNWAWAQGWIEDIIGGRFLQFGVSIQKGRHDTLGTSLGRASNNPYDNTSIIKKPDTDEC
ncbi:hypothetical protein EMPS_03973 [Entomortierella parvispora]|uniref:Uncharacterized protein n=1 Tax=Entomortierella parvispora TaxID=205924 RepID=A0A9P3H894_9FUNG|nr:hypothetical protein EMPS_03973 [Entomortierella parvispora]